LQHDRREDATDDEENAIIARQKSCSHANVRGSKYQSRFCPACGKELLRPVEEDDDSDGDSSEARKQKLRAQPARKKATK
jgi:predicted RNA-binding Zn-ribbon protein involved in translation (DUF1610 family)